MTLHTIIMPDYYKRLAPSIFFQKRNQKEKDGFFFENRDVAGSLNEYIQLKREMWTNEIL